MEKRGKMSWKEFFKLTKWKVLTAIAIGILFTFIGGYLITKGTSFYDFGKIQKSLFDWTIIVVCIGPAYFVSSIANMFIRGVLTILLLAVYYYLISCVIIYIVNRFKK
jgi:hypothetical protein